MRTLLSAFGVVHTVAKSQTRLGAEPEDYTRAVDMTPEQRASNRVVTQANKMNRLLPGRYGLKRSPGDRGMHALYSQHGYFMREQNGSDVDPVEEMKEPVTPSARHKGIHYGASVPPEHQARFDKLIKPSLVAQLKHPVHVHYDPDMGLQNAALRPHSTTGHIGHVVIADIETQDMFHSVKAGPGLRRVLNHEIGHTATSGGSPLVTRDRIERYAGNEAHADVVSGTDAYIHGHHMNKVPAPIGASGVQPEHHYHRVRSLMREARKARAMRI